MISRKMPEFHAEMVEAFMASSNRMTGLPEFLGLRIVAMEPGGLTAEMTVDPKLLTGFGNMHGGVLSAACDHVLGCVCYPHMEKGQWAATTEFKINLLAPAQGDYLEAVGTVVRSGRTLTICQLEVFGVTEQGRAQVALGQQTLICLQGKQDR